MHLSKATVRRGLSDAQREQFVHQGFGKVRAAFSSESARSYFDWRINLRSKGRALLMLPSGMPEATATGVAGTVFLCHPFLVHAAQRHRGATPRFLAQPPLVPRGAA
jgi:hypothetical protein